MRERLGASQFVFAEAMGVKFQTLQSWEMGRFVPDNAHLILMGLRQRTKEILKAKGRLGTRRDRRRTGK